MLKKTSDLIGATLDYAVARVIALGTDQLRIIHREVFIKNCDDLILCRFSTDWAQGGPIIEQERVLIQPELWKEGCGNAWSAISMRDTENYGPTALIAAMRTYVASTLGDEVEIPDCLVRTK